MDTLLNEYRAWRDQKIEEAFDEPVSNAEALKEYVKESMREFHYEYESSITLRQYKQIQYELLRHTETCPTLIIEEPVFWWCTQSIMDDDWDKLFNDHEPETEEQA